MLTHNLDLEESDEKLKRLCAQQKDGFALSREFYTSDAVFQHDIKSYWNNSWIWVGHICQVPEPGDFFLFDYGPESVIIARDRDGEVGAFINVCRHRGSRVCVEKAGNARVFSCPYHAWTYELNGRLRAAREMDDDFDAASHGLLKAQVRIFQGLIFVCASEQAPEIDQGLARIAPLTEVYGLEHLKIAHEASFPVPANWKLAVENYMECYHCAPAHLEYSRSHSLKDPKSKTEELMTAMADELQAAGMPGGAVSINGAQNGLVEMDFYFERYPLYPGYKTGSRTGEQLAPLLGKIGSLAGCATDIQIGIINNFLAYGDHVVGYRFVPRSLQETDIQVVWYVHKDAVEGRDYDKDALTWLWHVTSLDDERIIRINQEGVNSHYFRPGPLSEMEWGIRAFYAGYLDRIKAAT